ncbi:MAG: DUF1707 domain-containing protein [Marmoricola sp.]
MDEHRQPRDGDRNPLRDRIRRAVAEGRISAADGDIRLANVSSAQSMTELGLIARDLDQLEAVLPPASAAPAAAPAPPGAPPTSYGSVPSYGSSPVTTATASVTSGFRRTLPVLIVVLVVSVIGAGGAALFAFSPGSSSSSSESGPSIAELPSPLPPGASEAEPGADPTDDAVATDPPKAAYALTEAGVRSFLALYRGRFGTSKVVELTLYGDYVIVQVPLAKHRHSGWLYRDGSFTDFGGTTTDFPGSAVIDTRRVALGPLLRNVAKARRTLKVEDPTTTYVILGYRPQFDPQPHADIHVSNKFNESGYLSTTLAGAVLRSYPFSR